MKEKKQSDLAVLLGYAGSHKGLTFLGLGLSAVAMVLGMLPYICIWLVARDLIAVAPDWTQATGIARYGWMAFAFSFAGILVYFAALMCTHLAAFRTASNIRKAGMAHLMKAPLGFFDSNASGLLRNRLDGAASETETLLAHNLADIVGTVAMFLAMLVLMFVYDWRMGAACLLAAVVSVAAMATMMGGKNAGLMAEYQAAQDTMSKAGTEYVRGIPVVKVFQQTVYSFKAFKQAIEDYSAKAEHYQADVCKVPQAVNLTFTEGAFIFLVPAALLIAPGALKSGNFAGFVTNFAFYAVFSAIISTALAKIMFAASGMMLASTALGRINQVMSAPILPVTDHPQIPKDNSVVFKDVSFTYDGAALPALDHVSFRVEPGQTVALVGPSGGGKTTISNLLPRFYDVTDGAVLVDGQDVRTVTQTSLRRNIGVIQQEVFMFAGTVRENIRYGRPDASDAEIVEAAVRAEIHDEIMQMPDGYDSYIGERGIMLSGGQKQRISIARVFLKNPKILVLDEATSALDTVTEQRIQASLDELSRGRTTIVIAHRLSTVKHADCIAVVEDEHIVEQGSHDELMAKNGVYAELCRAQAL